MSEKYSNRLATETDMLLSFQAHATASSMFLLIKKGVITRDEYNQHLKMTERNLIEAFKNIEANDINFSNLIIESFDRFYIPDDGYDPTLFYVNQNEIH